MITVNTQTATQKQENIEQIIKDIRQYRKERKTGIITIHSNHIWDTIDRLLGRHNWYMLPVFAKDEGVYFTKEDCLNYLKFVVDAYANPYSKDEMPYSLALVHGGFNPETASLWLSCLNIINLNGQFSDWFFDEGYAYKQMKYKEKYAVKFSGHEDEISLTHKGSLFIHFAKNLYVNYGHKLTNQTSCK